MLKLLCYAKINFILKLIGKRPDGYHDLNMVLQSVSLADILTLRKIKPPQIVVTTNKPITVNPRDNLVYKAAELLLKAYPQKSGVEINIKKNIPLAAGLAGGSADCAGVLHGLNRLFNLKLQLPQLERFANQLGSDIAFCLQGGTMLAEGRGEKLTKLPPVPKFYGLILKPPFPLATAEVYAQVPKNIKNSTALEKINNFRNKKVTIQNLAANLNNDLYTYALKLQPSLVEYSKIILTTLPVAVQMSGSGPAFFAFYENRKSRDLALSSLSAYELYPIEVMSIGQKFKIF